MAFLAQEGLAPSSIKGYLAALRHSQILLGYPEPREVSSLPRLRLILKGVARTRALQQQAPRPRLPITGEVLGRLFETLNRRPGGLTYHATIVWAVCSMAFFGFFRLGEIILSSASSFNPAIHLAWRDVCVDCIERPTVIRVHLRVAKCDQFGRGVDVFLSRVDSPVCPVAALLAYMAVRGSAPGPFFVMRDGLPFLKSAFVLALRELLTEAGMEARLFSGHSFCIGAATTAAMAGLQDSSIQALGRWSSYAFQAYVRTPRQQLAMFSHSLAALVPQGRDLGVGR